MTGTPVVGPAPARGAEPKVGKASQERRWTFSFRFFHQHDNFGVGQQGSAWFISLLERLKELSTETIAEISTNPGKKMQWRFHDIDWSAKNIPITRNSLSWVDKEYINNEAEFIFQQFQISKALGRVVGFMDENGTFNIVLLDPLHNAQPSEYSAYKIRNTVVTGSHFARVMTEIEIRISACGTDCGCRKIYGDIQGLINSEVEGPAVIVGMTQELFEQAAACVSSGVANSMAEIIEVGLGALED